MSQKNTTEKTAEQKAPDLEFEQQKNTSVSEAKIEQVEQKDDNLSESSAEIKQEEQVNLEKADLAEAKKEVESVEQKAAEEEKLEAKEESTEEKHKKHHHKHHKHPTYPNFMAKQIKGIWLFLILLTLLNLIAFGSIYLQMWNNQRINQTRLNNLSENLSDSQGNLAPVLKFVANDQIDRKAFKACLNENKYQQLVQNQMQEGLNSGVQSTPTSVIFDMQTNKTRLIEGALPFETISKELNGFKNGQAISISNNPQNPRTELNVKRPNPDADNWKGPIDARFVWVEYSDFECPYCKAFWPELKKLSEANSDLAFVYRHFPLTQIHPNAQKLAEASECYKEQKGKDGFWQIADKFFG